MDHPTALLGLPKGPVLAQKGPFWGPRQPLGPELVPTATDWSNWTGCIHIMCMGPLRDLYGTPRAPKGPVLVLLGAPEVPGQPRGA